MLENNIKWENFLAKKTAFSLNFTRLFIQTNQQPGFYFIFAYLAAL